MDSVKREKQIQIAFKRISSSLQDLDKSSAVLSQTLEPILRNTKIADGCGEGKQSEERVQFAVWLNAIDIKIRAVTQKLQDLNDRSEL